MATSGKIGATGPHDVAGTLVPDDEFRIDRADHDLAFWERSIHALLAVLSTRNPCMLTTDELRRATEAMEKGAYYSWGYYEHWAAAMTTIMFERQVITQDEFDAELNGDSSIPMNLRIAGKDVPAIFKKGDLVRIRSEDTRLRWRKPHLRCPGYIFGMIGRVNEFIGYFDDPYLLAFRGTPVKVPLYSVTFPLPSVWSTTQPGQHTQVLHVFDGDTIDADIYQEWMELYTPGDATAASAAAADGERDHEVVSHIEEGNTRYGRSDHKGSPDDVPVTEIETTAAAAASADGAHSHEHSHVHGDGHGHDHGHTCTHDHHSTCDSGTSHDDHSHGHGHGHGHAHTVDVTGHDDSKCDGHGHDHGHSHSHTQTQNESDLGCKNTPNVDYSPELIEQKVSEIAERLSSSSLSRSSDPAVAKPSSPTRSGSPSSILRAHTRHHGVTAGQHNETLQMDARPSSPFLRAHLRHHSPSQPHHHAHAHHTDSHSAGGPLKSVSTDGTAPATATLKSLDSPRNRDATKKVILEKVINDTKHELPVQTKQGEGTMEHIFPTPPAHCNASKVGAAPAADASAATVAVAVPPPAVTVDISDHGHDHDHGHSHDHNHEGRYEVECIALKREGEMECSPGKAVAEALLRALYKKGVITREEIRAKIDALDSAGINMVGADLVVRCWRDPAFQEWLCRDGPAAARSMGIETSNPNAPTILRVYANTDTVHNVVVCTLCSCYPFRLLGYSPAWYKSRSYRARVVREPRKVLAEFGTILPSTVKQLKILDSTADCRYMVIPQLPSSLRDNAEAVSKMSDVELRKLVTRDSMIGVTLLEDA